MKNHNYYINAIRSAGLQAILQAGQGHPGMVVSSAPINYSLFIKHFNMTFEDSKWVNRDRFVLSAGHGSMSWYPILYFSKLIDENKFKNFRQKISGLSGHPETSNCEYVDATTGPLGQGISNGVGMAIAEAYLRKTYSKLPGLIDHYTYVVVGDGDLQEGICYESMSLAGKLKLNKLIVLHDSNKFQLESSVGEVNSEDLKQRMISMNWNYISCNNDFFSIDDAINLAKNSKSPTFIEVNTIIGEGLPQANSSNAHGFSLQKNDYEYFEKNFNCEFYNWNFDQSIYDYFHKNVVLRGQKKYEEWKELIKKYQEEDPKTLNEFLKQVFDFKIDIKNLISLEKLPKNKATRVVAGSILQQISEEYPDIAKKILVLSPDISKSTNISINKKLFNDDHKNNMILAGIREFGMCGIQNGIQLHGGLKSLSSSFLSFFDYMKPAVRLASINEINPIYFFTHDSIAIGSDGPTHQPIEQLATLRTIPHLQAIRPCDEKETLAGFIQAFDTNKNPTALILSRQNLESLSETNIDLTINQGGYKIRSIGDNQLKIIFLASGSEVMLALQTSKYLFEQFKISSEIWSIPNLNKFIETNSINPLFDKNSNLISIEASNDPTWYKLAQILKISNYLNIGINEFGYSIDGDNNYHLLGMHYLSISNKVINFFFKDNQKMNNEIKKQNDEFIKTLEGKIK